MTPEITLHPGDSIRAAVGLMELAGGGIIHLAPGTYYLDRPTPPAVIHKAPEA